jgi:hypothetical protein
MLTVLLPELPPELPLALELELVLLLLLLEPHAAIASAATATAAADIALPNLIFLPPHPRGRCRFAP